MTDILLKQYNLLQGSRDVLLGFIENNVGDNINKPVSLEENSTIRYLLVHTANCYFHWLKKFALQQSFTDIDDNAFTSVESIRPLYANVDKTVALFLETFAAQMEVPINGTLSRNRQLTTTPLELFTHVYTHEFHHKGQIVSMSRAFGCTPPDTDVIRF